MLSIITLNGVSFVFPNGRSLFSNLSFSLHNERTALVGANGIGKSTLVKIILGELAPSGGSVRKQGSQFYLPQMEVAPAISIEQYIEGIDCLTKLGQILIKDLDRSLICTELSGGQWMRLRLSRLPADSFLILDEPTNDLDLEGKKLLANFLRRHTAGWLLISHDRELLSLSDAVLQLSNRGLDKYGGGWGGYEYQCEIERRSSFELLQRSKKERDRSYRERTERIEKQDKRNRRGQAEADKGGMPKILIGARKRQAESTSGKIDKSTLEKKQQKVREAFFAFNEIKIQPLMYLDLIGKPIPEQKLVFEAVSFNIIFEKPLYRQNLNCSYRGNIRLAIKGSNGSGKSSLIKALLGANYSTIGSLRFGSLKTLYLDQKCEILDSTKSILENVREHAEMTETEVRNNLARLLFFGDEVFKCVDSLSGGERLRAALACGLLSNNKPELLILDEPTNNLDLQNIHFLESIISQFQGALIIISHDEAFLSGCKISEELQI